MSLSRKDVRLKLDFDIHAAVLCFAEQKEMLPAEWVEEIIVDIVKKRVRASTVLVRSLEASGSLGTFGDERGNNEKQTS